MLLLAAIARLIPARPQPESGIVQPTAALGHLGLTIIALIYVLITVWQG